MCVPGNNGGDGLVISQVLKKFNQNVILYCLKPMAYKKDAKIAFKKNRLINNNYNCLKIPKNSLIIIRYGSVNRDEDLFENPDKFDVTRKNARRHVAFGQGIHVCIGMNLARKEMYTAFPIILDRLKNMRI